MKPLMVLAHGTRTSRAQWDGYDELVENAQLLPIDLPGHGALHGQTCDYDAVIAVLDEALAAAGPGQPVILGGHSLGGYLAAMYAEHLAGQGRDELAALVLVGTTADPGSRLAAIYKGFAKLLPVIGFERMAKVTGLFFKALGAQGEVPGPESYEALADAWSLVFSHCGPHNLEAVTCPVVLVNGQFDQMRLHVKDFASRTPDATAHVVKGASHILPMTHPEELAAIFDELAVAVAQERG